MREGRSGRVAMLGWLALATAPALAQSTPGVIDAEALRIKPGQLRAPRPGDVPNLKLNTAAAIRVTIAPGPGYIDQKVTPAEDYPNPIQCWVDSAGKQGGNCETSWPQGAKVKLAPLDQTNSVFKGFGGNQPGCQGQTCEFAAGPAAKITAAFQPAAILNVLSYTLVAKHLAVTIDGPAAKCVTNPSSLAQYENRTCMAKLPKGKLTIHATYQNGGSAGAPEPLPTADWGGPCAGSSPGVCTIDLQGDTNVKIG